MGTSWELKWDAATELATRAQLHITWNGAREVTNVVVSFGGGTWPGSAAVSRNIQVVAGAFDSGAIDKNEVQNRVDIVPVTGSGAIESLDAVNAEIEGLIHQAWGR